MSGNMKFEIYGRDNSVFQYMPEKTKQRLAAKIGEELKARGRTGELVMDVLEIKKDGILVDTRLYKDNFKKPVSGFMGMLDVVKLKDLTNPKLLAEKLDPFVGELFKRAKQLKNL